MSSTVTSARVRSKIPSKPTTPASAAVAYRVVNSSFWLCMAWLAVAPGLDVRFGIGWGVVTVLDADAGIQDGPGWWAARDAIEWTAAAQRQPGLALVRTSFRGEHRTDVDAVNAALICRDHLIGSLDERSLRILKGLLSNHTKKVIAAAEDISASAVSQRAGRDGLDLIVCASQYIRSVP